MESDTLKLRFTRPSPSKIQDFLGQKYSSKMPTFDEALAVVNDLVLSERGKGLSEPEILVLRGSWHNRDFVEIAENSSYAANYLQRGVATRLWEILTKTIGNGKRVSKKNVRIFLEEVTQKYYSQFTESEVNEEKVPLVNNLIEVLGGNPPDISTFYGRKEELSILKKLITKNICISLVGAAGIGKSALASKLIQEINTEGKLNFDFIIWKSVAHAPVFQDFLSELLELVHPSYTKLELPEFSQAMISVLINQMQSHRCLIVLDESDALFQISNLEQQLEYKLFFRRIIEEVNHSCLLLTNRVFPDDFEDLRVAGRPIDYLQIKGLDAESALQFLYSQGLDKQDKCFDLIQLYYGNPLELKTVANRIKQFFGGSAEKFFENKTTLYSSQFQAMLDKSFSSLLNKLQREIMIYLAEEIATNSQWTSFNNLLNGLKNKLKIPVATSELIVALENLDKQSLIERSQDLITKDVSFTLQPIIKKYIQTDPLGLVHLSNTSLRMARSKDKPQSIYVS